MNEQNIVKQHYWDGSYRKFDFYIADDIVSKKMDSILESEQFTGGKCFEIGCFPCRYLAHFAKKFACQINGVDKTSYVDKKLMDWLNLQDIEIGTILRKDAFEYIDELYKNSKVFDFVYFVGFIEHFKNYKEVILYHDKIVRENGILVIETPNFRGVLQYILHLLVDKKNLDRHVVRSMNVKEWAELLSENGYDIIYQGYFGGFCFWADIQKRNVIQKILLKVFGMFSAYFDQKEIKNSQIYSPYCLVAARKRISNENKECDI